MTSKLIITLIRSKRATWRQIKCNFRSYWYVQITESNRNWVTKISFTDRIKSWNVLKRELIFFNIDKINIYIYNIPKNRIMIIFSSIKPKHIPQKCIELQFLLSPKKSKHGTQMKIEKEFFLFFFEKKS